MSRPFSRCLLRPIERNRYVFAHAMGQNRYVFAYIEYIHGGKRSGFIVLHVGKRSGFRHLKCTLPPSNARRLAGLPKPEAAAP